MTFCTNIPGHFFAVFMACSKLEARGHLLHKTGTPPKQISRECISTLHWPKNDIPTFSKFLRKKVSRLYKISFLPLLNECRGLVTLFLQITIPKIVYKCTGALLSSWKTFFYQNLEKGRLSLLGRCNVKTVLHPGF